MNVFSSSILRLPSLFIIRHWSCWFFSLLLLSLVVSDSCFMLLSVCSMRECVSAERLSMRVFTSLYDGLHTHAQCGIPHCTVVIILISRSNCTATTASVAFFSNRILRCIRYIKSLSKVVLLYGFFFLLLLKMSMRRKRGRAFCITKNCQYVGGKVNAILEFGVLVWVNEWVCVHSTHVHLDLLDTQLYGLCMFFSSSSDY